MKDVTNDLKITGIELSIARLGATVTFKYLDEYEAKAWYLRGVDGSKWIETDHNSNLNREIELVIEENEIIIQSWIEEQFAKEWDGMDPEVKTYDIIQLQKKNMADLMLIAQIYGIRMEGLGKQELIYKILDEQAKA